MNAGPRMNETKTKVSDSRSDMNLFERFWFPLLPGSAYNSWSLVKLMKSRPDIIEKVDAQARFYCEKCA